MPGRSKHEPAAGSSPELIELFRRNESQAASQHVADASRLAMMLAMKFEVECHKTSIFVGLLRQPIGG
ncbi:hypothetical protein D1O30_17165 [Methylocystis hirsuta]|uniref:Uncharacterized protein n=1 Tax=Methylocystis hirsuta TaxID=369798 RepID=A0A3M9XS04_9HYPH|nr:hypothetical protein D1O30_17165 [Methylocystis hirsuta]